YDFPPPEVRRSEPSMTEQATLPPGSDDEPTIDLRGGAAPDGAAGPAGERYRILGRLGDGGMGQGFRAHDGTLQRDGALKCLRRDDPDLHARFRREAQAQARIEHPHVCRVYEVGESQGRTFIVMQLVSGRTLKEAAHDMTLAEKIEVLRRVAEGVHAAHRCGL